MEQPWTYKKIKKIGEGAFTTVIQVEDENTGENFAIKKIRSRVISKVFKKIHSWRNKRTKNPKTN